MTIKEIIGRERWFEGSDIYLFHNASIDRIEKAVNERIAELEMHVKELRAYEVAKDRVILQLRDRIAELEAQIQQDAFVPRHARRKISELVERIAALEERAV